MIYEYECKVCEKRISLERKIAERDEPVTCECGGPMQRTFDGGTPEIIFRGQGFYFTDNH